MRNNRNMRKRSMMRSMNMKRKSKIMKKSIMSSLKGNLNRLLFPKKKELSSTSTRTLEEMMAH
jgi:hypothetical protein